MNGSKLIFTVLLGLVLLTSVSFAATIYVNGTDNPCGATTEANYSTIQLALGAASVGDTIIVCNNASGYYNTSEAGTDPNVGVKVNVSYINLQGNESGVTLITNDSTTAIFLVNATYVNISNFVFANASNNGILLNDTATGNFIFNNSFYDNGIGINMSINGSNTILTNTMNATTTALAFHVSNSSTISYNVISNTGGDGVLLYSSYGNTFTGNNVTSAGGDGISLISSNTNTFTSDIVASSTGDGFNLSASFSNTLTSTTAHNNTLDGVELGGASYLNTLTSNTLADNTLNGVVIRGASYNNTLTSNTLYSNTLRGALVEEVSVNNTLTSNTVNSNTLEGVHVVSSDENALTSNTVYDNGAGSLAGILLETSNLTSFTSNIVYNHAVGIHIRNGSVVTTFATNNVTNGTLAIVVNISSVLNFSANNAVYSTPVAGYDFITNSSNSSTGSGTTYYRFDGTHAPLFFNSAYNVFFRTLNYTAGDVNSTVCTDATTYTSCQLVTPSYGGLLGVVNVTNITSGSILVFGIQYDPNMALSYTNVKMAHFNTSGTGWDPISTSATTTVVTNGANVSGLTGLGTTYPFATFGVIGYAPITSTSTSSDDTSTSKKTFTLSKDSFECETGVVVIDAGVEGATVSLLGVDVGYSSTKTTDSDGKASFTVSASGEYKALGSKDGYLSTSLTGISLTMCVEEEEPVTPPVTPPADNEDDGGVVTPPVTPPVDDGGEEPEVTTASEALEALNDASVAIEAASESGKLTDAAAEKLLEAQEAYEAGNYEEAVALAEMAITLIEEPEAGPGDDGTPGGAEEQPMDLSWLLYVVVVVVILVVAYFLLKGKKKGYVGFKR